MAISQYVIYDLLDLMDDRYWRLHWFDQLTVNQQTRERRRLHQSLKDDDPFAGLGC